MEIARRTLEDVVRKKGDPPLKPDDPALGEARGCFVTLRKQEKLRGCIGVLETKRPLYEEVIRLTRAASLEDFRFEPVRPEELKEIEIEISLISMPERVDSSKEFEVGRHGVLLKWRDQSGVFLPEVATQMGWTAEEFVRACGREKAHLPEEAWPEVELYRFTTERIKEGV